jgi:predicted O-linked N-acetylglucosamine transferase (SPINDLY family)
MLQADLNTTLLDAIDLIQSGRPRDALAILKPLAEGGDAWLAAAAFINAGLAFEDIGDTAQARQCYGRSLQVNSTEGGFVNLINLLVRGGHLVDAEVAAENFHRRHLGVESARMLAFVRLEQGRADEAAQLFAKIGDKASAVYYGLHAHEECPLPDWYSLSPMPASKSHSPINELLTNFVRAHSAIPMPSTDGRLRIGYLSADFRQHPRHRFLLPVLKNHDKNAVEIFLYSDTQRPDAATDEFRSTADHWRDVRGQSDEQLIATIRADNLHCLIDMTGLMPGNRIGVYRQRAAPAQILYPGYPGSTGVHDFAITDEARGHDGVERPLFIPGGSQCYDPGYAPMPNPEPPQARNGYVTFGGFHRPPKITPRTIELWAGAIKATLGSMIMLIGPDNPWLRSAFDRAGVNPNRLIFKPRCDRAAYMALHDEIDVMLDAYPYQGHSTTLDALWMGVPTMSRIGPGRQSRESCAFETHGGSESVREFVDIATGLTLGTTLQQFRSGEMREYFRSRFMDFRLVAAGIEDCCRQAVQ